jgi:hypothetical protein
VQGVGSVGDHDASATFCESIGASSGDQVPMLWANVIAEHVPDFDGVQSSKRRQFGQRIQKFVRLKSRFNRTGSVVHFGSDGASRVDETDAGEVVACGLG